MNINIEAAAVLIPIITGLMEIIKKADPNKSFERFYPLAAELLGFILGMVAGLGWLTSLIIGLAAMGLYSGVVKTTIRGE